LTLVGHTQPQVFASPRDENGAIERLYFPRKNGHVILGLL
jgi:hypothetical protein